MSEFPSLQWFRDLASYLEDEDEDFSVYGRWMCRSVGFRVDRRTVRVAFDRGLVLDVGEDAGNCDFLINGRTADWRVLFDTHWALNRLYRSGTLTIRADAVELMRDWKALFFVFQGMKRFGPAGRTA